MKCIFIFLCVYSCIVTQWNNYVISLLRIYIIDIFKIIIGIFYQIRNFVHVCFCEWFVFVVVVKNFSKFSLFLQNNWSNFTQTAQWWWGFNFIHLEGKRLSQWDQYIDKILKSSPKPQDQFQPSSILGWFVQMKGHVLFWEEIGTK